MIKGKHVRVYLTSEQRRELQALISSGRAPARTQTRARILLLSDRTDPTGRTTPAEGPAPAVPSAQAIADMLLCSPTTVSNVRRRFSLDGLESALSEKARPGQPPKLDGETEARLLVLACSEAPEGHVRWTLRLLADKAVELGLVESLSHTTVGETLKKTKSSLGGYRPGASQSPPPST